MQREAMHFKQVRKPVEALIPYARNARQHSDAQISSISASIREFGFTNPVLIDERQNVIAGHGRILAARKLGLADVPCIVVTGLTAAQRQALILADNRIALSASWDDALLGLELADLSAAGFDLELTGFDAAEVGSLLGAGGAGDAGAPGGAAGSLAERFGAVPFTVLSAREGWWQARKQAWLALGIQSELGRGGAVTWADSPGVAEPGLNHYRRQNAGRKANAVPGGAPLPLDRAKNAARAGA